MTLVVISFERLKAVVEPFSARTSAPESVYRKLAGLWLVSLVAASPLLYVCQAHEDSTGGMSCTNIGFTELGRQIYYSIHSICFFLVPLVYIIYAQRSIFVTLRSGVFPAQNLFSVARSKLRHRKAAKPLVVLVPLVYIIYAQRSIFVTLRSGVFLAQNLFSVARSKLRHRKAAKPLVALTVAFVGCWSPFIITRMLIYFQLTDRGYIWRASQLLICVNATLDPILYGIYGENLKSCLKRFFTCTAPQTCATVGTLTEERVMRRIGNNTWSAYNAKS